jgi:hypothetical protein
MAPETILHIFAEMRHPKPRNPDLNFFENAKSGFAINQYETADPLPCLCTGTGL